MYQLAIAYCKYNLSTHSMYYNQVFAHLFIVNSNNTTTDLAAIFNPDLLLAIQHMLPNSQQSFILFKNSYEQYTGNHQGMLILYITIDKHQDTLIIRLTNWLNWLHSISNSLEHSYTIMSNFNNTANKNYFRKIADAACYKAFYPLITYIPNKFAHFVNQATLFSILRLFIKHRGNYRYSKDYARNIHSRIKTNLKKEFKITNADIADIIRNDDILNICLDGQLLIPRTMLYDNLIIPVDPDKLLVSFIEASAPLDREYC